MYSFTSIKRSDFCPSTVCSWCSLARGMSSSLLAVSTPFRFSPWSRNYDSSRFSSKLNLSATWNQGVLSNSHGLSLKINEDFSHVPELRGTLRMSGDKLMKLCNLVIKSTKCTQLLLVNLWRWCKCTPKEIVSFLVLRLCSLDSLMVYWRQSTKKMESAEDNTGDELWDDTLAGPRPEFDPGRASSSESIVTSPICTDIPISHRITIIRSSKFGNLSNHTNSVPSSPAGSSSPQTPFTPKTPRSFWKEVRRRWTSQSDPESPRSNAGS